MTFVTAHGTTLLTTHPVPQATIVIIMIKTNAGKLLTVSTAHPLAHSTRTPQAAFFMSHHDFPFASFQNSVGEKYSVSFLDPCDISFVTS